MEILKLNEIDPSEFICHILKMTTDSNLEMVLYGSGPSAKTTFQKAIISLFPSIQKEQIGLTNMKPRLGVKSFQFKRKLNTATMKPKPESVELVKQELSQLKLLWVGKLINSAEYCNLALLPSEIVSLIAKQL